MADSDGLTSSPLSWSDSDSSFRYYAQYNELVLQPEEYEDDLRVGEEECPGYDYYSVPDTLDHISSNTKHAAEIDNNIQSNISACALIQYENLHLRSTIMSPLKTEAQSLYSSASVSNLPGQQYDRAASYKSQTCFQSLVQSKSLKSNLLENSEPFSVEKPEMSPLSSSQVSSPHPCPNLSPPQSIQQTTQEGQRT